MGIGFPITETLPNLGHILKMLVSYELMYATAISTIKLSILFFYLRVFVNRGLRMATIAALIFVSVWSIGNFLQVFLICRPFAKTYTPGMEGECGDQVASFIAIGSFNIITDVIILTLPLPTVWALKMSTPAKLGLTGVFLVGLMYVSGIHARSGNHTDFLLSVSVVGIIRIVTLTQLDLMNLTGTMIWADFWSATEPNLAILCVSLPMMGSLWSRCVATRRGNSKLAYHSSESGTHGSAFSKLKNQSATDTQIPLESIYAANQTVQYRSAVAATDAPGADRDLEAAVFADKDKDSGSEVALTEQPPYQTDPQTGIRVQTKWSISHD
jgi:hypothetical protein